MNNTEAVTQLELNRPQALANIVMPNELWCFIGRGGGKTSGIIAPWVLHKVLEMPRSSGGMVGQSFADLEAKILRPLIAGIEMQGYLEGVHFIYGKEPPKGWERPYFPVVDYKHVFSFPNGTTFELISLQKRGSANSLSLQWIVADEVKFLSDDQLRQEVYPVLRGNVGYFGDSPWYGAKLMVTDKLGTNVQWLLNKRKLVDHDKVRAVLALQLKINAMRLELTQYGDKHSSNTLPKIRRIEQVVNELRKDLVYVVEASAKENIKNLAPSFFDNMKRSLTPYEYAVSIENEDPTQVEHNYYPDKDEKNLYLHDAEDRYAPIGVALDYQASISPLVAFQVNELARRGVRTLTFLESRYVLYPKGLRDVVQEFCQEHEDRPCKIVNYFYDHTAVGVRNTHKKFYEEVRDYFVEEGWRVNLIYMGQAPGQNIKFTRLKKWLGEYGDGFYPVMIHKIKCNSMLVSMDLTETTEKGRTGTGKDKSKETDKKYPQELAPHLGDTFDQAVWGVNELKLWVSHQTAGFSPFLR